MGLNLQIVALTVPEGTEFPGTVQELLDLFAQYESITGEEDFSGINYGPVEPDPDNRDRPWFKTDNSFNPIGWFSWDGSAWTPIPLVLPSGTTANRPSNAQVGQLYLDTDIDVTLRWNGAIWITDAGSPGDVKDVRATTLADALEKNPGWAWDEDSAGKFIVGATDGSGAGEFTAGDEYGETEHTITLSELPNDAINLLTGWGIFPGAFQNGSQAPGVFPITTGLGSGATKTTGPINPNTQESFAIIPPTLARWRIYKL